MAGQTPRHRSQRLLAHCQKSKKTDVGEHLEMFPHVGLLFNEPPGWAGLSFA
jgi:hypothetical protein